ncbi:AAA family ATPase [Brevibacterium sp. CBA3109]|uniref:AAA family ATPase n=1 Tax=Brevibacterium koreense TaxID=3140787 RepID=A0AAU7UHN3_9MICO
MNFFFGSNGSGKTTISRAFAGDESLDIAHDWNDSVPMAITVYNRDFVDQVLRESSRIPGVFVLGESSVDAEARLEAIEKDGGERQRAHDKLDQAKHSLTDATTKQDIANDDLKSAAWTKYKAMIAEHGALTSAFTGRGGIGNDSKKLLKELLSMDEPSDDITPPTIDELLADAEAIFADDATARYELSQVPLFTAEVHDGHALLGEKVVGSSEVSLSELVERLGNSDWVSEGRGYLRDANGLCPFCQQEAPKDLAVQLATMFDDHYAAQIEKRDAFASAFREWADNVTKAENVYGEDAKAQLDPVRYRDARAALKVKITRNLAEIDKKERTPSEKVTFYAIDEQVDALNSVIDEANTKIRDHNRLVQSRRGERPKLVTRCWRYLSEVLLKDELAKYRRKAPGLQTGVDVTQGRADRAAKELQRLDQEVRDLQRSVESSKPVIHQINHLLRRSGFTSFEIVESKELQDGYMLSRDGVALHERSLSEGERTFIAFLYYFYRLDGREPAEGAGRTIAVIDDPISSLDSDVLFIVGALVRNLINRALSGQDRISQVILLTHNVYFHKEITHLRHGDSEAGRGYYVIRKHLSAPSDIEPHSKNPITTEYQRLWGEVRRAVDGEQTSIVGLENILRRILESYFRIMGNGIWEEELVPLLTASERPVLRSLFTWVNEGSHSVFEDVHYSPGPASLQTYLDVFRRVFREARHEAHYNMMLYGKQSLNMSAEEANTENSESSDTN